MAKTETFAAEVVEALRKAKILGVRSGTAHRFTGVWVVVVDDRVFVRSWNDKPTGWFQASSFCACSSGWSAMASAASLCGA